MLFLLFVLSAASKLRGAARTMEVVMRFLKLSPSSPSWHCGRLWLLRRGYYKLTRPKDQADDWVWIVDHTVQIGIEKCLVILGIRLCHSPNPDRCLSHSDVEPITLLPVTKSNGEVVYQQLKQTIKKTGVPREIIGDYGSDLKSGIEKFCREHPKTCYLYDIKHKTAAILKRELQNDSAWVKFTQLAAKTKSKVQQTALAPLAPPNQRTKARYMNIDVLIQWGQKMITFLQQQGKKPNSDYDQKKVKEKLGWLILFNEHLEEWGELLQVVTSVESFIRKQGISRQCHLQLKKQFSVRPYKPRPQKIVLELLAFVEKESLKTSPEERLIGSSEVIESVFGKQKQLEHYQAKSGFTGLILGVAAMVSSTTSSVVKDALEKTRTKEVIAWCKNNLEKSVQAKRKEAFSPCVNTE